MQVTIAAGDIHEPPVTLGALIGQDVRTVVVRDFYGNPIFVAIQQNESNIWAASAGDPHFADLVAKLGISSRDIKFGDLSQGGRK